jgi:hypothetical protein
MIRLAIAFSLALVFIGCITDSPKTRVVHEEYTMDPACLHEDSTTWTDTTETRNMSCVVSLPK